MLAETAELEDALRHERALRRLAATLCGSAADVDDAVQHAVSQVALGRRPRAVPLLAFLRTTLRNHVFNLRKLASRRRQREAVVAGRAAAALPVDELVAREQLRRHVASAVLALAEPYRSTVWLRWFEDYPVDAIAKRMQVPGNTVRTRLQRAHTRLRARLDRDYGDRQWIAVATPMAAKASAAAAATAWVIGGILVAKKTLFVVVCLAVIVGSAWWIPSWLEGQRQPEGQQETRREVSSPLPEDTAPIRAPVVLEPHESPLPDAPATVPALAADPTEQQLAPFAARVEPGCVEGIVLRGLEPVAAGKAWLRGMRAGGLPWGTPDGWDAAPDVRRASIDPAGLFRFESLDPDTYAVGVQAQDGATRHVYFDLPAGEGTRRIRIVLGTATVRGSVFDLQGLLAPSWHVALFNHGQVLAGTQLILGTTTNARGEFEFGGLCGGTYRLQASPVANFGDPPQVQTLQLVAGEQRNVLLGLPPTACDWSGRVLLPRGQAIGVQGSVELELGADGAVTHHRIGPHGDFKVRVLAGSYRAMLRLATGTRVELGMVEVSAGAIVRDLMLPNAVRIRPTFVDGSETAKWPRTSLAARLRGRDGGTIESVRGTDGFEYFFGVAAGDYLLQCRPHPIAGAPAKGIPIAVPTSDELEVDIVVEPR